ncbi:MAG: hypoxanthine phosphoribosyltransferase [Acidimicrobiia bacterium]|nr:hypoxanthine phosphoribosyltransferase [Acidimicrobiia bacterium]
MTVGNVLITEDEIQDRIRLLAAEITKDYESRDLLLVGILKGAVMLMADLARAIELPMDMDFMAVSSYGAATQTSGVVRIIKDLERDIEGRDVLIVEDIIDSGLTLNYLLKSLSMRKPASIEVCSLLVKEGLQRAAVSCKYPGFTIPPDFVVGYGLDYLGLYRNLPYITVMNEEEIAAV